jgi:hypothetical protein
MSNNRFSGSLPTSWATSLQCVVLVPESSVLLARCVHARVTLLRDVLLRVLDISNNQVSGTLPAALSDLIRLTYVSRL